MAEEAVAEVGFASGFGRGGGWFFRTEVMSAVGF